MSATYMQTSVTVPDGALGGPLVNLRGEVIGVNARLAVSGANNLASRETSGLALPSNIASAIFQALLMSESKESPWLGISVLAPNDTLRKKLGGGLIRGIVIDNVFDPSPASRAGIQVNDVLSTMDDRPISTVYDFQRILYERGPGSRVRLGIVRAKKPLELELTIERRPPEALTH
jgi:S1-C subfamily serine protease